MSVPAAFAAAGLARSQKMNFQQLNRYMMQMKRMIWKVSKCYVLALAGVLSFLRAAAQDGAAGIEEANSQVRSYFEPGTNLMYAIGAVLGLVGAVKVFQKWNAGDQDTGKVAAAWFGSCIFLVVVATVLQSFFGL